MDWNMVKELIKPELLVLIPVLYVIGAGLKRAEFFEDKYIPLGLGIMGIILVSIYIASTSEFTNVQSVFAAVFASITQGILCAGCAVYANQIAKQIKK